MRKDDFKLSNIKKYSKLIEPWWSYLLFAMSVLFAVMAFSFTIYGIVLYFISFKVEYLTVIATFIVGDIATTVQLLVLSKNINKNNRDIRMKTLDFYNKYKLFFEEYRLDIAVLDNIYLMLNRKEQKPLCQNYISLYRICLSSFPIEGNSTSSNVRKRLFKIFNQLDEIISFLAEGTLESEFLIDKLKDDITEFVLGIKPIYELTKSDTEDLHYPENHSFVYLDKVYELCYDDSEGGGSSDGKNG